MHQPFTLNKYELSISLLSTFKVQFSTILYVLVHFYDLYIDPQTKMYICYKYDH